MKLEDYKIHLKHLIAEKESAAMLNLQEALKKNSILFDRFIILHARFNMLMRKETAGLLSSEQVNLQLNQIRYSLLEFINELKAEDLIYSEIHLEKRIKPSDIEDTSRKAQKQVEKFLQEADWEKLEKIGQWSLDVEKGEFQGSGVFQYLLSNYIYGHRNFSILSKMIFNDYQKYADAGIDNGNAGIILGWLSNNDTRRYFNLLFTGEKLLLEGIGLHGGDDYLDFVHFDQGVDFHIEDGREYSFAIQVGKRNIDVFVDNEFIYSIQKPEGFIGRVGLRPWRSKIRCSHFEIQENNG